MKTRTLTFHCRAQIEHLYRAATGKLANYHFQIVNRFANQEQDNEIWDEEGAPAIIQSGEGKPPHVAQAHGHGDAGHEELHALAPGGTLLRQFAARLLVIGIISQGGIVGLWNDD